MNKLVHPDNILRDVIPPIYHTQLSDAVLNLTLEQVGSIIKKPSAYPTKITQSDINTFLELKKDLDNFSTEVCSDGYWCP